MKGIVECQNIGQLVDLIQGHSKVMIEAYFGRRVKVQAALEKET